LMPPNKGTTWTVSARATVPSTEPGDDTVRAGWVAETVSA
jgi:hypothetical protein